MEIKKIRMRPEGTNDYGTVLHPETSVDQVVGLDDLHRNLLGVLQDHISEDTNPHNVTKAQVGLRNVTDDKQMPIAGGQFAGIAKAHNNTSYTVAQIRNIILSPNNADVNAMNNGDIWIKYE